MMGPMTFVQNEYQAAPGRYGAGMPYRRTGVSGLDLPAISLGLWHNFGGVDREEDARAILAAVLTNSRLLTTGRAHPLALDK